MKTVHAIKEPNDHHPDLSINNRRDKSLMNHWTMDILRKIHKSQGFILSAWKYHTN